MMGRKKGKTMGRWLAVGVAVTIGQVACYHTDDEADGRDSDSTSDPDTDSSTDSDTDTNDSDSAPLVCEVNSGYPCACDGLARNCQDGSLCAVLSQSASKTGFCTLPCTGTDDEISCVETLGYGIKGYCGAALSSDGVVSHCVVICRAAELSGPCPPGLVCQSQANSNADVCLPPPAEVQPQAQ